MIENEIEELINKLLSLSKGFQAYGNKLRIKICVVLIKAGENGLRVGDIASLLHISRPACSYHLSLLTNAKIVSYRTIKRKNYYYYSLNSLFVKKLKDYLNCLESIEN